jgi:hypothetical protein
MQKPRAQSSPEYRSSRRWTLEQAMRALAALDRSGLTLTAFAIREGLDPQRLSRWRRQLAAAAPPVFEEVIPRATSPALDEDEAASTGRERFEVVLRSGRVVRVPASFDVGALRRLLAIVEEEARPC